MTDTNELDQNQSETVNNHSQPNTGNIWEGDSSSHDADSDKRIVISDIETPKTELDSRSLDEALQKFNIQLPAKTVRLLDEYCNLLWTWNEKLNLTRHTTYDKFVSRDLVDSLHLAALLQKGEHVLDVGSGGGVPGLVIAILRPDVVVELCEATGKKATALGKMIDELKLDNNVWYSKAQDLLHERRFHTLTIRAVDRMYKLLMMFRTSWNSFNRILMIKGPRWVDERGEARHYNLFNSLALRKVDEYVVSKDGEDFTSVILQVCLKKKLDEIKIRAIELAEGKPYPGKAEEIAVADISRLETVRNHNSKVKVRRRFESKGGSRSFIKAKDNRYEVDAPAEETRVYSRRNGKPPRGWTGKKGDFRPNSDVDKNRGNNCLPPKGKRPNGKRASDNSTHTVQNDSFPRKERRS